LSALTDLDSKDLATLIISEQVHELSETVQWSDGSITVLSCIMKNGANIIQDDANAVSFFMTLPESTSNIKTRRPFKLQRLDEQEPTAVR
jgi:hypothetical protein